MAPWRPHPQFPMMNVLIDFDSARKKNCFLVPCPSRCSFLPCRERVEPSVVRSLCFVMAPPEESEAEAGNEEGRHGGRGRIEMRARGLRRTDGLAQSFSSIGFQSVPRPLSRQRCFSRGNAWRWRLAAGGQAVRQVGSGRRSSGRAGFC